MVSRKAETPSAYVEGGYDKGGHAYGSSSGSAVGVSAGFGAVALGTDSSGALVGTPCNLALNVGVPCQPSCVVCDQASSRDDSRLGHRAYQVGGCDARADQAAIRRTLLALSPSLRLTQRSCSMSSRGAMASESYT